MSADDRLKAHIRAHGPLTVAQYMAWRLHDPHDGYYAARPALGEDGDFITAPLVSQMFGELIGLWAVQAWRGLGRPAAFALVEAGPGDGTLMSDMLRAARLDPAFLAAADLWLVETSPVLRQAQGARLSGGPLVPRWADSLEDLPGERPILLVANELLDCLPARQFVRTERGWAERMVGLDADDALTFGMAARPAGPDAPFAQPGDVVEVSPAQEAFAQALGARIARQGGVALLIDYGRDRPEAGDTLQALRRHQKVSPLEAGADLTVHADFPAVAAAAEAGGAKASAILPQGELLARLGLFERADALAKARPDRADIIGRQLARLTAPEQMGTLFKALAIHASQGPVPPGFEEHR
ncbi:MAG TPA: SAM-dependent methyltransferase [Caulobacteraceae bacterium]|nr:SAM-dependent methyltransferase [Caulobacteraceae bacterium]